MFKFFSKKKNEALDQGLAKTKQSFWAKLGKIVAGKSQVDSSVLDDLEELLITSDVGVQTTLKIIDQIEKRVARDKYLNTSELSKILKEETASLLKDHVIQSHSDTVKPHIILVVGVNGVGKTTTIGKLAHYYKQQGLNVILGAADTFRAAAIDQLQAWGQRVGVPVIARSMNSDPASVAHETVKEGLKVNADIIIIDTAGRLHTKINLMHELSKIKKTIQNLVPNNSQEVLLVLDGSTGQNAFVQAEAFTKATDVSALAITKLDGTAKGGIVIGISDQFKVPVKYIGVGEGIGDLQIFDRHSFVETLFGA